MLAIGGYNEGYLKICEQFCVAINKWTTLAPLNIARNKPGTVVLESLRAFAFCGNQLSDLPSIERAEKGENWKIVAMNRKVASLSNLTLVSFRHSVLIFGGSIDGNRMLLVS